MNWNYYEQLEGSLRALVTEISILTSSETAVIVRFLDVGEYGVAFETLCAIIKEDGRTIPEDCKAGFKSLAEQMNIDRSWWESLLVVDNSRSDDRRNGAEIGDNGDG